MGHTQKVTPAREAFISPIGGKNKFKIYLGLGRGALPNIPKRQQLVTLVERSRRTRSSEYCVWERKSTVRESTWRSRWFVGGVSM